MGDDRLTPHHADELSRCFAAHARQLFGYACALAREDLALAEELVQATFEAAGRTWPELRELAEEQRHGWLRSTVADIAASSFDPDAAFRPDQLEAIADVVVDRARVLCVQRTGWGKSAVYFVATALLREAGAGPTLFVSPLLALMRNQVEAANRAGIHARTINSANMQEWEQVYAEVADGQADVLLVSPERLNNPGFRDLVLPKLLAAAGMLVVDEAHCISDWGHDFRPDYMMLGAQAEAVGAPVRLALTATAAPPVRQEITRRDRQ